MITDVSLRLLYLIFDRLLGWLTLLGRASSSKDVELWKLGHLGPTLAVQFASGPPPGSGRVRWHDQPDRHVKEDKCLREP